MLERIGRLLTLVLIGYAKACAATLWLHTVAPRVRLTMRARFGTSDLARNLIRICRGMKLPAALDIRLPRLAAPGHDTKTPAERAWVSPSSLGNRSTTNADRRAAGRGTVPPNLDDDLPSEARIAAMIRRVRAGAVIAAIVRDLRLVPAVVSQQQWSAVHHATTFGGDFARLFHDIMLRIQKCSTAALDANAPCGGAVIRGPARNIDEQAAPA